MRTDRVVRDAVAELAQARDRALALARARGCRRPSASSGTTSTTRPPSASTSATASAPSSERSTSWRRIRSPGCGRAVEARPAVAAGLRRLQQLAVVRRARSRSVIARASTQWNDTSPSGSAIVTTSSRDELEPADEQLAVASPASKLEKYIGTPSHSPSQPSRSLAPSVARKSPPGRSQVCTRSKSAGSSSRGTWFRT